jgi:cobalamin biosynthesis protein CobW
MNKITKIPTTIITGFLGAGKTSLIKHVMEQANGRRIALLINEFGDVGVDGEILKSCGNDNCPEAAIIELPNGCICCTVADDFLPAMKKILAMEGGFDHIIIETSGLALPKPLVKAFDWPEIRSHLTVDGVIAVIDTPAVLAGNFAENNSQINPHDNPLAEVYEDQLLCADMIILNKSDQVTILEIEQVKADILQEIKNGVPIIEAAHGRISPDILLGIGAAAEDDVKNRISHHENEVDHDHDDFVSFVLETAEFASIENLQQKIQTIAELYGVLRVKGFVQVAGKPLRYLVQAVGRRVLGYFDSKPQEKTGNLVIIGRKGLDIEGIRKIIS